MAFHIGSHFMKGIINVVCFITAPHHGYKLFIKYNAPNGMLCFVLRALYHRSQIQIFHLAIYTVGLFYCHWGNRVMAVKQHWRIWVKSTSIKLQQDTTRDELPHIKVVDKLFNVFRVYVFAISMVYRASISSRLPTLHKTTISLLPDT